MSERPGAPRISRRLFLGATAAAGIVGAGGSAAGHETRRRVAAGRTGTGGRARPSIVLFLTDDHGPHLGCLGTRGLATPHIDRLASDGVLFPRAYAPCASCSPSRGSILTGMYPHANGLWRNVRAPTLNDSDAAFRRGEMGFDPTGVHEDVPTLVELLRRSGYFTAITQKFHITPPWKFPFEARQPTGRTPQQTAAVVREILVAAGDRPCFLMVNIGNTHRPFWPRIEGLALPRIDPAGIEVPPNLPDVPAVRADLADYLATVQLADACIGAALDVLRQAGRWDDTLIAVAGDQGYGFQRAKASLYELGIRVPLVLRAPGGGMGLSRPGMVSLLDLMPTFLEYAGLDCPETVQGHSLRPLVEGGSETSPWEAIFAEHNAHGPGERSLYPSRSVCTGRWKYHRNLRPEKRYEFPADLQQAKLWGNRTYAATVAAKDTFPVQYELLQRTHHRPAEELYDLHSDPWEMTDLAGDARFAGQLETLRAKLDDWMRRTGDTGRPETIVRRTDG